jgi:hypothetical protein
MSIHSGSNYEGSVLALARANDVLYPLVASGPEDLEEVVLCSSVPKAG